MNSSEHSARTWRRDEVNSYVITAEQARSGQTIDCLVRQEKPIKNADISQEVFVCDDRI
jgi:hypothetical protein